MNTDQLRLVVCVLTAMTTYIILSQCCGCSAAPCVDNICSWDMATKDIQSSVDAEVVPVTLALAGAEVSLYVTDVRQLCLEAKADTSLHDQTVDCSAVIGLTYAYPSVWGGFYGHYDVMVEQDLTRCMRCDSLVHELLHVYLERLFDDPSHNPFYFGRGTPEQEGQDRLTEAGACGC